MNDSETLTLPEETDFQETATREQVRPKVMFKGKELTPYSRGTRILYRMVCDDQRDLIAYQAAAFVFIHSLPRSEAIKLCWGDLNEFRAKVLEFREAFTDGEEEEAFKIWKDELQLDVSTRVIAEPPEEDKKKDAKT